MADVSLITALDMDWEATRAAVTDLESELICGICGDLMKDPFTLSVCHHHFCNACIRPLLCGATFQCPQCAVPVWMQDLHPNRQLNTILRNLAIIKEIISQPSANSNSPNGIIKEMISSQPSANSGRGTERVEAANREISNSPDPLKVSSDCLSDLMLLTDSQTQVLRNRPTTPEAPVLTSSQRNRPATPEAPVLTSSQRNRPATPEAPVLTSSQRNRPTTPEAPVLSRRRNVRLARPCSVAPISNCRQAPSLPETRLLNSDLPPTGLTISDDQSSLFIVPSGDLCSEGGVVMSWHTSRPSPVDVSVDLSHSALDEVGVRGRLREAAQVATHLHSVMNSHKKASNSRTVRCERGKEARTVGRERGKEARTVRCERGKEARTVGRERGKEISSEEELVRAESPFEDVNLFGPSPPKRHQGESVLDSSISPLGRRKERRNCLGETELHILAKKGKTSELRACLQSCPDPSIKDHAGWTPLHEACVHGHVTAAQVLLEHGALVNVPGHGNDTPLHDAVANNHCSVAALLLRHGASCLIRNRRGLTAQDLAHTAEMKQILASPPDLLTTPSPGNSRRSPLKLAEQQLVLLGSGLSSAQKAALTTLAKQLSAQFVTRFSKRVTHVIVNEDVCVRTFKVLCGVATGKWILRFEWVAMCASAGVWVGEAPFEVAGLRVGDTVIRTACCRKSRLNTALKNPGLFDGCSFFLAGDFTLPAPSKEELSFLIQLSDGKVLSREPQTATSENTPPSCAFHSSRDFIFNQFKVLGSSSVKWQSPSSDRDSTDTPTVVQRSDSGNTSTDAIAVLPGTSSASPLTTVAAVPATWILDSLSHFKLLRI